MSIESAIDGNATDSNARAARTRLHGRMIDVHIDKDNPLRSYITVEADPKNNLGMFAGIYNVALNEELTPPQRYQSAKKAQERGSGVCGGLINERMIRRKGKPVLLNNFRLTGDQVGTCRWIDFSRKEVHRRAALVHTAEVKSRNNQGAAGYPRITHITVLRHEAFEVEDAEAVERLKTLADKHFTEATRPRDHKIPKDPSDPDGDQMQHLRSSMPRSAFAFVIIDDKTKEVLEYSDFIHCRRTFKDSDMPAHFTQEDVQEFRGRYPSLPFNGESIQMALNKAREYADKNYSGDCSPKVLCVEGVRYRISKVAESTDIQSSRSVAETPASINDMSPVELTHLANQSQYLAMRQDGGEASRKIRNCAYVPDVTFNFADNKGDTFSRFIDCKTEYPSLNVPWITQITFNQEPLVVPEIMKEPAINPVPTNRKPSQPEQGSEEPGKSPQSLGNGQESHPDSSFREAPAQESHSNAPAEQPADASQQSAMADDPSFAESERLGDPRHATDTPKEEPHTPSSTASQTREEQPSKTAQNPDADLFHGPGSYTFGS